MATVTTEKTSKERSRVRRRVRVLATHPIQYQAPLFRVLAADEEFEFEVLFLDDHSLHAYHDRGFGQAVEWNVPLLDGYEHDFVVRGRRAEARDLKALARKLKARPTDVLWVHGWGHPLLAFALLSGRLFAERVLVRAETRLDAGPNGRHPFLRASWHSKLLAGVDGALAIGSDNRDFLVARGIPPERIFRMPYAVDAARFGGASDEREQTRRRLAHDPANLVVLFVGKFAPHKAPLELARAARLARERGAPLEVWFVGAGAQADELNRVAEEDPGLRVLGFVNQRELPTIYAAADALCLPSHFEPWGLVANEAAHAGLALLLSDRAGATADLVLPGETGEAFPAGDVDELTRTLCDWANDPERVRRMAERARALASSFDFESDRAGLHQALGALFDE